MARIECGKHLANHADISSSEFIDVNMAEVRFDDVNMSKANFHNINLSDIEITAAQLGGASFKHIGLPDGSRGKQRPILFEEADLNRLQIRNSDLRNAEINECNVEGMRVNGILVSDLLKAYEDKA